MTGLIPPGPLAYEGQLVVSYVSRREDPTTAFINFNVPTIWINTANGNIWILVGKALGIANWVLLGTGSSGPAIKFGVPAGSSPVLADGTGLVTFTSTSGTIAITGSSHTINFDLVGGGVAIETFLVQAASAPGLTTVTPSSGQVTINGSVVAAHSVPVETRSRALHAYNVETQVASAVAATPANTNSVGLVCFNDAQFTVDATSGMASLKGSTSLAPILTVTANSGGAVSPNASGNLNVVGDGTTINAVGNPGTNTVTLSTIAPSFSSAFFAYLNPSVTNVIGNSLSPYTVPFNNTVYDISSEFNTSTNKFTATVAGYYYFTTSVLLIDVDVAMTECQMSMYLGSQILVYDYCNAGAVKSGGAINPNAVGLTGSAMVHLTAGQTAYVAVVLINGAGATAGIYGNASTGYSFFNGYLVHAG